MNTFLFRLLGSILGLFAMVVWGCAGTPATRFFVLSSITATEKVKDLEDERCLAIGIGPVRIPEYLNRPEIVTGVTSNEVRMDEFAKWAEPLEDNIQRALAENLLSLLCIRAIDIFPHRGHISLDCWIDVQVIDMNGIPGETALLDISWSIYDGTDERKSPLLTKRSSYIEPAKGEEPGPFVLAQSRNLASFSREIADAVLALSCQNK
ncbi:MAG: PqiC family protein [Dissulfuribacterales bacterium]